MTHYLDTNSSRVLAELYRTFYGYNVVQAGTDRLNIQPGQWNVDDNGTPVAVPDSYGTWWLVQDFETPSPEFEFWFNVMVEDSGQIYSQTVNEGGAQYHTTFQKSLLGHQAELKSWEDAGFPVTVPHFVSSRWQTVMGGAAGNANSHVYHTDLLTTRWYSVSTEVEFGKLSTLALWAENYMTAEQSGLIEDAIIKTSNLSNFSHPDPFGWVESKINQYNGLLLDYDGGPNAQGLKQRWEAMPVATWEASLGLTAI